MAFPRWTATESLWKRKVVSRVSWVASVNLRPSSNTKFNPSELQIPLDSSATATKACVRVIAAYFNLLAAAAWFAASPASVDVVARCDFANVSETVTSQVRHLPHDHGISVTPSGRLPSSLVRPNGSFWEGMFALPNDRHTISFSMLCRCCLPAVFLQTRPWSPLASTLWPQWHKCGSHSVVPSRIPTAILITSSDKRKPNAVTGGASNQSPACGAREAKRRARSSALFVDSCRVVHALLVQRLSHSL